MATIDGMLVELPDYTLNANLSKEMVLNRLLVDDVITKEQFDIYNEKWQIIIIKNSWFKSWMNKLTEKKDRWSYKYVKFED